MESDAPPIPEPVLRELVIAAEAEAHFDWEGVDVLSGVTYSLQVASDADFAKIEMERSRLTDSEYDTTEEDRLKLIKRDEPY